MPEIAARIGPGRAVVEFGAGSATKTPILLRAVSPSAYVPIDISGDYLQLSAAALDADFPALPVHPVVADFMGPITLPSEITSLPKLGFFPGSTIGNLVPETATNLLRRWRDLLGVGSLLLIGMDRVKLVERLLAAYDDPEGVTAAFNLNLLERINRELGGNIPIDAFAHQARWNAMLSRIEMHLVAIRDVDFTVDGQRFHFERGASIHTENSHKYGPRGSRLLLLSGGWTPLAEWADPNRDFAVILAVAEPERFAP
jgi:dimethylhistidine N-methyltransferase